MSEVWLSADHHSEGLALDVGVDNAYKLFGEYRPIHLDEVREYMEDRDG